MARLGVLLKGFSCFHASEHDSAQVGIRTIPSSCVEAQDLSCGTV